MYIRLNLGSILNMADFIIKTNTGKYVHTFSGHSTVSVSDKKQLAKKYPSMEEAQAAVDANIHPSFKKNYSVIPLDEQLMKEASKPVAALDTKYAIKYKTTSGKEEFVTGWKGKHVLKPVFETTKDPIKADKFDTKEEAQKILERMADPKGAEIVSILHGKTASEEKTEQEEIDPQTDDVINAMMVVQAVEDKVDPEQPKDEPEQVKQYTDIHDTGIADLNPGSSEIWYLKGYHQLQNLHNEYSMGSTWMTQHGVEFPTKKTLSRTHVCVGKVQSKNKDKIYHIMQGDIWSPNGEANQLIESLGLDHTSISMGDILIIDDVLYMVDRFGFYEITPDSNNHKEDENQNKKASAPNMPYAVNTMDYQVGDIVRQMYNGRDVSPFTGTVVRVDSASNKVDVEFPMGTERCAPEELIKQNAWVFPPNTMSITSKRKIKAALTKADLESAAETLLNAGYSEDEAISILSEGMEANLAKQAALRQMYQKVASRMPLLSLVTFSSNRKAAIYDTYKGCRISYEQKNGKWVASCKDYNLTTEECLNQIEARKAIKEKIDANGKEMSKAATGMSPKKAKFKKDMENLFKRIYATKNKEELLELADNSQIESPNHYAYAQLRFWLVNFLNKVEKDIEDNPNIVPNTLKDYIIRYQKEV
jgi:methylphosphotriester-DNA--protein-cysteine methyltransferase